MARTEGCLVWPCFTLRQIECQQHSFDTMNRCFLLRSTSSDCELNKLYGIDGAQGGRRSPQCREKDNNNISSLSVGGGITGIKHWRGDRYGRGKMRENFLQNNVCIKVIRRD